MPPPSPIDVVEQVYANLAAGDCVWLERTLQGVAELVGCEQGAVAWR